MILPPCQNSLNVKENRVPKKTISNYQLFFNPVPRLSSQRSSLEKEASMNAGHVAATDWETRGYELHTRDIAFAVVATNTQC